MFFKASILVLSLYCAAALAIDPIVTKILENHLNHIYGLQMEEANSKVLYVQRVIDGFKNQEGPLDRNPEGKVEKLRLRVEALNLAIDRFIAASERSTCKQAISDLKNLFPAVGGRVGEFIGMLEGMCLE